MTYRRILTLVGILFCVQTILAQTYHLHGKVTDATTGEPLAGATIHLAGSNNGVFVDSSGSYKINKLAADTYTLVASFMGYESSTKVVTIGSSPIKTNFKLSPSSIAIKEVVVTGTGTEHDLQNAPVQTEVISGRALKEYAGREIEDVLNGLSASLTFIPSEMGSGIHINGLKNDYVLILIDGQRMSSGIGGQNDLSRINMNNIQRIEIVKGAASSLYGSDAIGGVINFITKKNQEKFSIANTTRIGEHEDLTQNNVLSIGNRQLQSTTSFNLKHTHGWRNTTQELHRKHIKENSVSKTVNRSTNYAVGQRLIYKINPNFSLDGHANFDEKWTTRPQGFPNYRNNDLYYRNQAYGLGGKWLFADKNWIAFNSTFDRNDYFYDYKDRETTNLFDHNGKRIIFNGGDRELQSSQRRMINTLKSVFYLGSSNTLHVGAEHIWDKLVAPYRLPSNKSTAYALDLYAQDEWDITPNWNLTGGMRFGMHKDFENTFTPKLSTRYKWKDFNFRASYSQGFKAPTMKELYYHYYATLMSKLKAYYGDPNLKPQRSNYYSASVDYTKPKFTASVTAYTNHIRDMISLQTMPTSYDDKQLLVEETMHYVNLAKARTFGIDVTFSALLPHNLSLAGGYSYLNAKAQRTDDEEAANYMQYTPMDATSKHNANLKLHWFNNWRKYRLGITLNGRYQSKRYYTSHGNAKAHQLWRLNTAHNLINNKNLKLDINAGIDNIFDYVDRTPFGINRATRSPGRNYYLSVSIKYQTNNN